MNRLLHLGDIGLRRGDEDWRFSEACPRPPFSYLSPRRSGHRLFSSMRRTSCPALTAGNLRRAVASQHQVAKVCLATARLPRTRLACRRRKTAAAPSPSITTDDGSGTAWPKITSPSPSAQAIAVGRRWILQNDQAIDHAAVRERTGERVRGWIEM